MSMSCGLPFVYGTFKVPGHFGLVHGFTGLLLWEVTRGSFSTLPPEARIFGVCGFVSTATLPGGRYHVFKAAFLISLHTAGFDLLGFVAADLLIKMFCVLPRLGLKRSLLSNFPGI